MSICLCTAFFKVPPQHFDQVEVWILPGPFLFFFQSFVSMLVIIVQFGSSISPTDWGEFAGTSTPDRTVALS